MNHAKAANVPIIVAINKMDKETANPDRVTHAAVRARPGAGASGAARPSMSQCRPAPAQNIDKLLEVILVVAELLDLKANPNRPASASIIEAERDRDARPHRHRAGAERHAQPARLRGRRARSGAASAPCRTTRAATCARPSRPPRWRSPGLADVPKAGDMLQVVPDEKTAREVAEKRSPPARLETLLQGRQAR